MMSFIVLITLLLLVWFLLGYKRANYTGRMKRYHTMPVNPTLEVDTEPDMLSDRFYCMYLGNGRSISGYTPAVHKKG
jgi:hypothetical protein